ncbi:MAG: VWA domain-containing protein [Tidjanibacter sp.]|nr:VWA domain-containing protein [Tidjanibacter sp.]
MFRFENIEFLYLLLLVPLLIGLNLWTRRERRRRLERFGNPETLQALMPDDSPRRRGFKSALFIVGFTLLVIGLARPQIGSKLREVEREGIEIMLAIDVSNSMLAEDFEPNRLERTKYAVGRLLEGIQEDKIGVIIFAGDAYVQLPITGDYVTARNFVSQISTTAVSKQGTNIAAAIDLAANSFSSQSEGSRVVVLITDGENHEQDALASAKAAAARGIKIYTIGIGTPEGAPIRIGQEFIRDEQGEMVVSKLDEKALEEIALTTGGAYIRADNRSMGLDEIVAQINATEKSQFTTQIFEEYDEKYQYFVAAALLFLLLEMAVLGRKNRLLARINIFDREKKE